MNIAIITGASGGIGSEFVRMLVSRDIGEIWAVGRNKDKLDALRAQYGEKIIPVAADLCTAGGLNIIRDKLGAEKPVVQYLVNNAGAGKMGSYKAFTAEEICSAIDLGCKAPVLMSEMCLPYMEKGGRIINICSAAAFQPVPYINLYAASKAFDRSWSRALNAELKGTGITSTAVCPGWVDTDMLYKESNGRKIRFPGMVKPERVVKKALKDADKGRDMSVCSLYVKYQHLFVKLLPQKTVMRIWTGSVRKYVEV